MGRLIDIDILFDYFGNDAIDETTRSNIEYFVSEKGTVEAIPKDRIKSLGEELRSVREGIKDETMLIGFNMAVAICNKYLGEENEKEV